MINGKPVLCISSGSNIDRKGANGGVLPRAHELSADYAAAFANAGFVNVISAESSPFELSELCDALCLSGGPDLLPSFYGEEPLEGMALRQDPLRDGFELELAKRFLDKRKPIFAICRGFQLLNCVLGGTLYQDTAIQLGFIHRDLALYHFIDAKEGSVLDKLFGGRFRVNSIHHQAVKTLGDGLFTTAVSVEGIIEAYEHKSLPIIGTQFHPERMTGAGFEGRSPDFAPLFAYFADLVINNRK